MSSHTGRYQVARWVPVPGTKWLCSPVLDLLLHDHPWPCSPSTCPHGPAQMEPPHLSRHSDKENGACRCTDWLNGSRNVVTDSRKENHDVKTSSSWESLLSTFSTQSVLQSNVWIEPKTVQWEDSLPPVFSLTDLSRCVSETSAIRVAA